MLIRTVLVLLIAALMVTPAGALSLKDPLPAEGATFDYDIVYNGDVVGSHLIRVEHSGENIKISHKRTIEVDILFVKAFSEKHEAIELWSKSAELLSVKKAIDRPILNAPKAALGV